ncbi:MAG: TonB-dependent receptor [Candidatus Kapabacteria bacterium]|jgi:iron complex outermembrane receptor protein|nr:TonB-dependent receptor [Candidatus Kapabacteria bacterium]
MKVLIRIAVFCLLISISHRLYAGEVKGKVVDVLSQQVLAGVKIQVLNDDGKPVGGTVSKAKGEYLIQNIPAGSYTLTAKYIGYEDFTAKVVVSESETTLNDISLIQADISLEQLVVTASRKQEKALDAPAAISLVSAKTLERDAVLSPEQSLRNVAGVDVISVGVNRQQVSVRGFNQPFFASAFAMVDFRQASLPATGVNAFQFMPISHLDIDHIEVVRGPSSALFGSGADVGVIHFLTKDPFLHPGTAVSLAAGNQSLVAVNLRHANIVSDNFAYKINAQYNQAQDWLLDPNDPANDYADRRELNRNAPLDPRNPAARVPGASVVVGQRGDSIPLLNTWQRDPNTRSASLNAMGKYKVSEETALVVNLGVAQASFSGLANTGSIQIRDFTNWFGQIRAESGGFFGQISFTQNITPGTSYNYADPRIQAANGIRSLRPAGNTTDLPAPIADQSMMAIAQAQQSFDFQDLGVNLIVGLDSRWTNPITNTPTDTAFGAIIGRTHGRNELKDEVLELGAYVQAEKRFGEWLTLNASLRYDYHNVLKQSQLSPRLAAIVKVTPETSVRLSYNRAFSAPPVTQLFLDINANSNASFDIRGRGSIDGLRFARNSAGQRVAVGTGLLPSALGFPRQGDTVSTQLTVPLASYWATILGSLSANPQNAPIVAALRTVAAPTGNYTSGLSAAQAETFQDIPPLKATTQEMFELGFQTLIAKKVVFSVDGYFAIRENFIAPLILETPLLAPGAGLVAALTPQVQAALTALQNNPQAVAALQQTNFRTPQGFVDAVLRPTVSSIAGAPYALMPLSSPSDVIPSGSRLGRELMLAYRNYGRLTYWGFEASVDAQDVAVENLNMFANVGYISTDFFTAQDLGLSDNRLFVSMNSPTLKIRGGVNYAAPKGISAGIVARYQNAFPVASGVYTSPITNPARREDLTSFVNAMTLVDVNVGYDFDALVKGLRLDVTVQNALDNRQRQYIGAPAIGRMVIARATFTF